MEGKVTQTLTGVPAWVWEEVYESEHDLVIIKKKISKKWLWAPLEQNTTSGFELIFCLRKTSL